MNYNNDFAARAAQENAIAEAEQRLLGWQLKGDPGAVEFAAKELRNDAIAFEVPHSRIQQVILAAFDAGRAVSVTPIGAELADYPAFHEVGGIDYLLAMAGAAPATTSPENIGKQMRETLLSWRRLQGPMPKAGGVELVRGDTVKLEAINWIWPNWLAAGKLHILAGQAETGKTTIAIAIAATISSGGLFPDGVRAPVGDTLVWSGEDDFQDTILPRFIANGGIRERIHLVKGRYDENCVLQPFDPAWDIDALVLAAKGLPDLRLIMIDPVVSAVPGDSHKNAEVRRGMQPLVQLGEQASAAILGITHLSKGTAGRDPIERITGSLAFAALPRLIWGTAKSPEPARQSRLVRVKSNIGPGGGGFEYCLIQTEVDEARGLTAQAIQWGEILAGSAKSLIAELEGTDDPARASALDAAKAWLVEMLGTGTVRVPFIEEMAKEKGHAWPTVLRAKTALGVASLRQGSEGWAWQMPKVIKA